MQKHIKVYFDYFGYVEDDFIPSEISGQPAVDIHHIIPRSQGGKDEIGNLIAETRDEHDRSHFKKEPYIHKEELFEIHKRFMNEHKTFNS